MQEKLILQTHESFMSQYYADISSSTYNQFAGNGFNGLTKKNNQEVQWERKEGRVNHTNKV